jgi:hypothetical protein
MRMPHLTEEARAEAGDGFLVAKRRRLELGGRLTDVGRLRASLCALGVAGLVSTVAGSARAIMTARAASSTASISGIAAGSRA